MIVVSYLCRPAAASLANHRQYADRLGYDHEWVDASIMPQSVQSLAFYKLEVLQNALERAGPGGLVLILSENAAILEPIPLEHMVEGADWLLVRTDTRPLPQTDVQIWRNTGEVRRTLLALSQRCRPYLGLPSEGDLFVDLESRRWQNTIGAVYPVMPACFDIDPLWDREPTFAVSIRNTPPQRPNTPDVGVCPRFTDLLIERINRRNSTGEPVFSFTTPFEPEPAERSCYNPGRPIALVTLYTPNAGRFARIAEANFRRYCERHGYTLYVHRDIPAEVGMQASGNWFKPWLLRAYMEHHEWVVWLDADVLFGDMERRLEPLMEGRDLLLANDAGHWKFNSGVMGFRRMPQNEAVLHHLMVHIMGLEDKDGVWASGGDQAHFIEALEQYGLIGEGVIQDHVAFNTYWEYRRPDSFIVHYAGMWWDIRAMMMAQDEGLLAP